MARPTKRIVWRAVTVVMAALAFAAILLLQIDSNTSANNAQRQANSLANQVTFACKAGGEPAAQLTRIGACRNAGVVKANPAVSAVPGAAGPEGPEGPKGTAGPQGPKGDTGAAGPVGPQGGKGDQGSAAEGPPGVPGKAGIDGKNGDAGAAGPKGDTGPQGPGGPSGPQGPAGSNGANGKPPSSWTFVYLGHAYTCTRNNADDSAPTYNCE